ncbi:MAG: sigma-54-dependent transcriptional regulator [Planctomycetota bacterium]
MSRAKSDPHVLLVEDDPSLRTVWTGELERMGFRVQAMPRADTAIDEVRGGSPDAVLLDLNLPGMPGMQALEELLALDPSLQIIVCTGHGSVPLAVEAMRKGAMDFLTKPVSLDVMEQTLRRAVATTELVQENQRLRRLTAAAPAPGTVGRSPAAVRLDETLQRIARTQQAVLLLGESGSGKELAARRLHTLGDRAQAPFVAVNCGAVPRQLMESELFGHVKGAFTGADQKRLGLLEAASGGTLFLDEVGELALDLQPALLRAVQFGEIRPVGSDQVRKVDVRVIAATHRDLHAMIEQERFREDLYYRLAVLEVRVPPLRERVEDIAELARMFLRQQNARTGRELALGDAAVARLERHPWPGNVRELENAIVRLSVLATGPEVSAAEVEELAFGSRPVGAGGGPLPTLSLRELEKMAITEAMRRFDGNKRKAAEALGVALKTLYNKLNAAADAEAGDDDPVGDDEP